MAPKAFWGSNHYRNPPLAAGALRAAQEQLGVTLPPAYVALLRHQNGGYTKGFVYPMSRPTSWAADHVPLDEMAGIQLKLNWGKPQNILLTREMTKDWENMPPRQVLLAGDGHWWVSLDYRRRTVPRVSWIDLESDEDLPVASTFEQFLEGLVPTEQFKTRGTPGAG